MMNKSKVIIAWFLVFFCFLLYTGTATAANNNITDSKTKVLIAFKEMPGPKEKSLVLQHGGTIKHTYSLVPAVAASLPQATIDALSHHPLIACIEPDVKVYALGELSDTWGVNRIGAGIVHEGGNIGTGVNIAVIDSGIDYNHPDLDANYAGGYDFANKDTNPMDDNGHGTHVAGTIGAEANGAGVIGVAPGVKIYALKVLDADGSGYFSDIIAALEWCINHNIDITNNSYGSSSDPGETVKLAFDKAYDAGILNVSAAGNTGNRSGNGDNVSYPARYSSVIAVAATDSNDKRANFSSTGEAVEISAPGVSIKSTSPGGGYAVYSGTSMASPHVAGTAALMIASGITDPATLRSQLRSTADDLGVSGPDPLYGYGLVDAHEAAPPAPKNIPAVNITSPKDGASFVSGTTIQFIGTASDIEDGDLTTGLKWTSSKDGIIGSGGSFSAILSDGTHTINAVVTDSGGKASSYSITINVGSSSSATIDSVLSINYYTEGGKNTDAHLRIIVSLIDNLRNPVANASVKIALYHNGSSYLTAAGITGTDGKISFKANSAPSGTYTTTVTDVEAAGLTWDNITPNNSYVK